MIHEIDLMCLILIKCNNHSSLVILSFLGEGSKILYFNSMKYEAHQSVEVYMKDFFNKFKLKNFDQIESCSVEISLQFFASLFFKKILIVRFIHCVALLICYIIKLGNVGPSTERLHILWLICDALWRALLGAIMSFQNHKEEN